MKERLTNLLLTPLLIYFVGFSNNLNSQKIAAGFNHSLFCCSSGAPQSVGSNVGGQLGIGNNTGHSSPVQVSGLN